MRSQPNPLPPRAEISPDSLDESEQKCKQAYRHFLLTELGSVPFRGIYRKPSWLFVHTIISAATLIGLVVTPFLLIWAIVELVKARKLRREWMEFVDRVVPVLAFPLKANSILNEPGDTPAPGLVMISFDRRVLAGRDIENDFMGALAVDICEIADAAPRTADDKFVRGLMDDDQFQPDRRRLLPGSITKGVTVYVCDLLIRPEFLKDKHLPPAVFLHPSIPCMAEPGASGRIQLIPWSVAESFTEKPVEPVTPMAKGYDIDAILEKNAVSDMVHTLVDAIRRMRADSDLKPLEQHVYYAYETHWRIKTDGIHGTLWNVGLGVLVWGAYGMKAVGALSHSQILLQAAESFGPRDQMNVLIQNFSSDQLTPDRKDFFKQLDSQYFDCKDNLDELLASYVRQHAEEFRSYKNP